MRFTIIHNNEVFYTEWYRYENNYVDGMVIINNNNHTYSTDGINFKEIQEDHL